MIKNYKKLLTKVCIQFYVTCPQKLKAADNQLLLKDVYTLYC